MWRSYTTENADGSASDRRKASASVSSEPMPLYRQPSSKSSRYADGTQDRHQVRPPQSSRPLPPAHRLAANRAGIALCQPPAQGRESNGTADQRQPEQNDAVGQDGGRGRRRGRPVDDECPDQPAVDATQAAGERQEPPELPD